MLASSSTFSQNGVRKKVVFSFFQFRMYTPGPSYNIDLDIDVQYMYFFLFSPRLSCMLVLRESSHSSQLLSHCFMAAVADRDGAFFFRYRAKRSCMHTTLIPRVGLSALSAASPLYVVGMKLMCTPVWREKKKKNYLNFKEGS